MQIFPLTQWQEYTLALEQHPQAQSQFLKHSTFPEALRIRPGVDARRLRRAFKMLCQRHETTRAQFRMLRGGWKCIINDSYPADVEVHDYAGAREEEIAEIAQKHARSIISMEACALVRLDLLTFGALGDVVVFRAHYAIVDGFGSALLLEDLIKLVLRLPLAPSALPYGEYVKGWGREGATASAASERYWEAKLLPPPRPLHLGRVKKGLAWLSGGQTWRRAKDLAFDLSRAQVQQLEVCARSEGVSLFMLVNTAFLDTIASVGSGTASGMGAPQDVLYSVTLGRFDGQLSRFAGHHTLHPLMRHANRPTRTLGEGARATAQDLLDTIRHLPTSAARRGAGWDRRLLAAGSYPRQITTGIQSPTGRLKSSPFAALFTLGSDQPLNIANLELSRVAMPPEPGDIDELAFRPKFNAKGGVLEFKYDAEAFETAEIAALADETFLRLGLKMHAAQLT